MNSGGLISIGSMRGLPSEGTFGDSPPDTKMGPCIKPLRRGKVPKLGKIKEYHVRTISCNKSDIIFLTKLEG